MSLQKSEGAVPGANAHLSGAPAGKKDKGFPIGTIHNGRQKVSSSPSKWVDLNSGKSYDDHNSTSAHDSSKSEGIHNAQKKILSALEGAIHPDDMVKAKNLISDWVDKKAIAKSLQQAANVESSATRSMSAPHQNKASKAFDEANKAQTNLIAFIKDSKKRKAKSNEQT